MSCQQIQSASHYKQLCIHHKLVYQYHRKFCNESSLRNMWILQLIFLLSMNAWMHYNLKQSLPSCKGHSSFQSMTTLSLCNHLYTLSNRVSLLQSGPSISPEWSVGSLLQSAEVPMEEELPGLPSLLLMRVACFSQTPGARLSFNIPRAYCTFASLTCI